MRILLCVFLLIFVDIRVFGNNSILFKSQLNIQSKADNMFNLNQDNNEKYHRLVRRSPFVLACAAYVTGDVYYDIASDHSSYEFYDIFGSYENLDSFDDNLIKAAFYRFMDIVGSESFWVDTMKFFETGMRSALNIMMCIHIDSKMNALLDRSTVRKNFLSFTLGNKGFNFVKNKKHKGTGIIRSRMEIFNTKLHNLRELLKKFRSFLEQTKSNKSLSNYLIACSSPFN